MKTHRHKFAQMAIAVPFFLSLIASLLAALPAWASPFHVQSAQCSPNVSGAIFSCSFGSPVAGGDAVLVGITHDSSGAATSIVSCTDDKSDPFTVTDQVNDASTVQNNGVAFGVNLTAGAQTITCTLNGNSTGFTGLVIDEYANVATASALDGHGIVLQVNTATPTSPTITASASGDLVWGYTQRTNGGSAITGVATGFTFRNQNQGVDQSDADEVQSAAGAVNVGFTSNGAFNYATAVIALKAAGTNGGGGGSSLVAVDSEESGHAGHNSATSPLTWSFTNTAGNLLCVGVVVSTVSGSVSSISISAAYNGVSLSPAAGMPYHMSTAGEDSYVDLLCLANPATGSHTVSVSVTESGATLFDILGAAISFSGADTSNNPGTPATNQSTAGVTTASVNLAGTTNGNIIINVACSGTSFTGPNAPTIMSALLNASPNTTCDTIALGRQATSGGSVTASWGQNSDDFQMIAAEIRAAPTSTGPIGATASPGTGGAGSAAYTYDALGRLTGAVYDNGASIAYSYDAAGNRTQQVVALSGGALPAQPPAPPKAGGAPPPPAAPPLATPPPVAVTISGTNIANVNIQSTLVSNGLAIPGVRGNWAVTIASSSTIGSNSNTQPALDTGAFPAGSVMSITNNGLIEGAAGPGGNGATEIAPSPFRVNAVFGFNCTNTGTNAMSGESGGPALRVQLPVTITNNGSIWGGGGGGGGGGGYQICDGSPGSNGVFAIFPGSGGGGGAGFAPGGGGFGGFGQAEELPGDSSTTPTVTQYQGPNGNPGSSTVAGAASTPYEPLIQCCHNGSAANAEISTGGAGGAPGQPGSAGILQNLCNYSTDCGSIIIYASGAGGAAGPAVTGSGFVTWATRGDVRGPFQ